jgi:hypothetical protein
VRSCKSRCVRIRKRIRDRYVASECGMTEKAERSAYRHLNIPNISPRQGPKKSRAGARIYVAFATVALLLIA